MDSLGRPGRFARDQTKSLREIAPLRALRWSRAPLHALVELGGPPTTLDPETRSLGRPSSLTGPLTPGGPTPPRTDRNDRRPRSTARRPRSTARGPVLATLRGRGCARFENKLENACKFLRDGGSAHATRLDSRISTLPPCPASEIDRRSIGDSGIDRGSIGDRSAIDRGSLGDRSAIGSGRRYSPPPPPPVRRSIARAASIARTAAAP